VTPLLQVLASLLPRSRIAGLWGTEWKRRGRERDGREKNRLKGKEGILGDQVWRKLMPLSAKYTAVLFPQPVIA